MKRIALALLCFSPLAFGQATPQGGTTATFALGTTTGTVTYTPVNPGNEIVFCLSTTGSISAITCQDNNSNALTAGPTQANGVVISEFYGITHTGATSYSCSWTTSRSGTVALEEYSGVSSVNASPSGNTGTSSTTTVSLSPVADEANDRMAMCANRNASGVNAAPTATNGTVRQENHSAGPAVVAMDAASSIGAATTVSYTTTTTNSAAAVAIEIRPATTTRTRHQITQKQ
jgi:hypothetical protein